MIQIHRLLFAALLISVCIAGRAQSSVTLFIPTVSGKMSDHVRVPIIMTRETQLATSGVTSISVTLKFNATMLNPLSASVHDTIVGGFRYFRLALPGQKRAGDTLAFVQLQVGLGNDSISVLDLDSVGAVGGALTIDTLNGEFHMVGICPAGGPRLVNPAAGPVALYTPHPNPTTDQSILEVHTIETGRTLVQLISASGAVSRTVVDGQLSPGTHYFTLSASDLPAGLYVLVMNTPTERSVARMQVVK